MFAKIDTAVPVEDKEESFNQERMIADMDEDVEDIDEEEPVEVEEVLKVVTAAKLITEHYNLNQAFLEKVEEEVTIQEKEIEEEGESLSCQAMYESTPSGSEVSPELLAEVSEKEMTYDDI
nr:hypothetical protein [Tanacetum cinerariifolium]